MYNMYNTGAAHSRSVYNGFSPSSPCYPALVCFSCIAIRQCSSVCLRVDRCVAYCGGDVTSKTPRVTSFASAVRCAFGLIYAWRAGGRFLWLMFASQRSTATWLPGASPQMAVDAVKTIIGYQACCVAAVVAGPEKDLRNRDSKEHRRRLYVQQTTLPPV